MKSAIELLHCCRGRDFYTLSIPVQRCTHRQDQRDRSHRHKRSGSRCRRLQNAPKGQDSGDNANRHNILFTPNGKDLSRCTPPQGVNGIGHKQAIQA